MTFLPHLSGFVFENTRAIIQLSRYGSATMQEIDCTARAHDRERAADAARAFRRLTVKSPKGYRFLL